MKNTLLISFLVFILFPALAFSQKAYEVIHYKGNTQNITLSLSLADGYIGASEILTKDRKTRKNSRFLPESGSPDEKNKLKFYHSTRSEKTFSDYFILENIQEAYENVPAVLYGKYYFNKVAYPIKLYKL